MKEFAWKVLSVSGVLIIPLILIMTDQWFISKLRGFRLETQLKKQVQPSRKKMTASTILLLIGTAFIVFASIAFVAANWNDMGAAGKVFTLFGASAAAFAVSAVLNAVIGLKRTSAAFYAMGMLITSVAFVTSGYYRLFGSWFCTGGGGQMLLYGAAAIIVSAFSFAGYTFFRNTAMHYIGFSFAALAVAMLCGQFSDDYPEFAVTIIMVQLVMTAFVGLLDPGKGKSWEKPLETVSKAAACVYGVLALAYAFTSFNETNAYVFIILAVVLVQLFFYGYFKKSRKLMTAADVFAFYASMIVSVHAELAYGDAAAKIVFSVLTLLVYAANRFIPEFGTVQRVVALAGAVIGAFFSLTASAPLLLQIAAPLLVSAAIAEFAFHDNIVIQYIAGIFAPFMPYCVTITISDAINQYTNYRSDNMVAALTYGGYALVCMAAAAAALFMRKICFSFHAKHPLKTQAFVYANLTAAGLALLFITDTTEISAVILALCAVHFALSHLTKVNFTAFASTAAALASVINIVVDLVPMNYADLRNGIFLALTAAALVASRFMFPEKIIMVGEKKKITADVFLGTAWLPIVSMRGGGEYYGFLVMLGLAIYTAAFVKKSTSQDVKSCILTGSAVLAAFALLRRPFLVFDSGIVTSKINLFIFVLLGIACKFIWRENKLVSKLVSTTIFVSCFASLMIDGIVHDGVLNRIFVLGVTAAVLVLSFILKSKTWFIASSISLVVLTVCFMHEYIASVGWWAYLLAVGIILVTVAAVNEACRKKGENVISTVERKLSDWTW
ncbi:MAG: hypothetical protein NC093_05685 [Alistipes sp.]|nr:hypothetical protein [Alistipes sp.]